MRILHVIHGFPPYNLAGSEIYTYNLACELVKKDDVHIFHRVLNQDVPEYKVSSSSLNGLHIYTINNTYKYNHSFESFYKNDAIAAEFGQVLEKIHPDVVHFGHLIHLSTSLIAEVKKRSIPIIFTLHDFWLMCPLGQLLKRDLTLSEGPNPRNCAQCMAPELAINKGIRKGVDFLQSRIPDLHEKTRTGTFLRKVFTRYGKFLVSLNKKNAEAEIEKRIAHIREMCSLIDLFIAPSKSLREKFVDFGIERHRIHYTDYGFNPTPFKTFSRVPSSNVRFGFTGTLIPSKGVQVLIEAFNQIQNADAELKIYGEFTPHPLGFEDFRFHVQSLGKRDNIFWMGKYDNKDVARIYAEIDVLVVPSIWYENSPLVIHEAFMANTPVITSNIGGMAELVKDGVNGLLFEVGNPADLAVKLKRIISDPTLLNQLRKNTTPVISIDEHVEEIRTLYHSVIKEVAH